jgi:hypothetical protein
MSLKTAEKSCSLRTKNHSLLFKKCYVFFSENNFKKCLKKQRFHPKNKQTLCGIDSTSLCE